MMEFLGFYFVLCVRFT